VSNWYAVRTATRQEHKVVDGLHDLRHEHRIPLEVYLPQETRWNRLTRVKTIKLVPMLPGYLFINVDQDHLWRVDKVEGVHQILGWGARQTVSEAMRLTDFVGELRNAQAAGLFDLTQTPAGKRPKLNKGEQVRICGGQFSGFIGQVVEKRGSDRVKLLVSIFGRVGPAIVPIKDIEAQDAAPKEAA
jgi:transcription antitermination factor NusG